MAHQDKENYTVILNSKNRIGASSSTDDANYLFDWGTMPEGEYKMTYSLCKQLYVSPLDTLLVAKPAWAIYKAENFDATNQLLIDSSPNARHATCTGCTSFGATGNGATAFIPNVIGGGTSTILFPVGSIPPNFTMFALSRYLDSGGKRILSATGENGPLGNFILGHFSQQFPQVYNHSQFLASRSTIPMTNYCNIGFSSASTSPNNVIFNGVGIGTGNRDSTGVVTSRLCVNLFQPFGTSPFETSSFALSQLIIWDRELTTDEMKIVSGSFTNYLETGVF